MPKIFRAQTFIATWFKQMSSTRRFNKIYHHECFQKNSFSINITYIAWWYFFIEKFLFDEIFLVITYIKKMACKIFIFIRFTLYNKLYKYRLMIRKRYWHAAPGQSSLNDAKHRCQTGATREHVNDRITIEGFYYKGT